MQNDILGCHAKTKRPFDSDPHIARASLPKALRCQHMRHFGHANAEGQRPQGAVGRSMAIAAYQQHAGLAQAGFGANHMHNALLAILKAEMPYPKFGRIAFQRFDHAAIFGIRNLGTLARIGRRVMVRCGENAFRRAGCCATFAQHLEGRGGAVMDEMTINIKQNLAIFAFQNAVAHPDLVEHGEGFRRGVLRHGGIIPAEPGFGKRGAFPIFVSPRLNACAMRKRIIK